MNPGGTILIDPDGISKCPRCKGPLETDLNMHEKEPEMENVNTDHLKHLGSNIKYKYDNPISDILEVFDNPSKDYSIELNSWELTSLCPKTKQPDFGEISIFYRPDQYCIESKSLKLYLFAFRNYKGFMEEITNKIADDIFEVTQANMLTVTAKFKVRGGIEIIVEAERGNIIHDG